MKLPRVLNTNRVPLEDLAPLHGVAEILQFDGDNGRLQPRADVLRLAPDLCGIINQAELNIDHELLATAPNLKVVANVAIGIDNFDLRAMDAAGVWGTNCPNAFADAAADATIGLILALARRLLDADRYVRSQSWVADGFQPGRWDGVSLAGKTLGIVGYGTIGQAVARRAAAFGMRIIYSTASVRADAGWRPLDALLSEADVVSLHVPLTPQTARLIDQRRLGILKRGAMLINMARGQVVDEAALVDALRRGTLAAAGLDVFEHEPRVHPELLAMPNVVLTPHLGGGTREARREARLLCAANIAAVLQGRPPLTPVNQPRPARAPTSPSAAVLSA
jgi:glyoxylate reductase